VFLLGCRIAHECNLFTVQLPVIFPPLEYFRSVMQVKAKWFTKPRSICKVSLFVATSSSAMLISYVVIPMVCPMFLVVIKTGGVTTHRPTFRRSTFRRLTTRRQPNSSTQLIDSSTALERCGKARKVVTTRI
jgi:hypothetical protein